MHGPRKIPTILGILLLIALLAGIGFIMEQFSRGQTRASTSIEPKGVVVTNITDTSLTFVWQTDQAATGNLLIASPSGKKYSAFDERDAIGKMGKYFSHSVTVHTLQATTLYDVTIVSNGKRYPDDKKQYQVTTMPTLSSQAPGYDPMYGLVLTSNGTPAEGAIVTATIDGAQTLSTIVRSSGSWVIPLSLVRTQDGAAYLPKEERMNITITVELGGLESRVMTDTLNDAPVPDITIGQAYDFRGRDAKKSTQPSMLAQTPVTSTAKPKQVVLGATSDKSTGGIALTAPAQGASITSAKPLITGLGIPGKSVTITIGISNPTIGTTTVGKDGVWRYTPTQALAPGKQSVTITTIDTKNKPVAITHTFTVLKSGSQVLGEATPSATLEPTPTMEATESATPTEEVPLAGDEIPTSGSILPTLILIVLGCILFIAGGTLTITSRML